MPRRSAAMEIMIRAATKAARLLARDFGEVEHLQTSIKGPGDFVSAADRRAEQAIKEELQKGRPDWGFLMEESGEVVGKFPEHRWIVDPLDGTTNFLHALPHWAISIGLEQHGEITNGLVYDPLRNEMFTAEKGNGAYVNDRRIRVSKRNQMDRCVIGCGLPVQDWKGREKGFAGQLERVSDKAGGIRRLGVAALDLAYVAAGRMDGYWEYGLQPWDIAAGVLIVREAGGRVGRLEGDDDLFAEGTTVAGNPEIYEQLRSTLTAA